MNSVDSLPLHRKGRRPRPPAHEVLGTDNPAHRRTVLNDSPHEDVFSGKIRKRWNASEASRRSARETLRAEKMRRDQKRNAMDEEASNGEGSSGQGSPRANQHVEDSMDEEIEELYLSTKSDDAKDPRTRKKRQVLRDPLSLDSDLPSSRVSLPQSASPDAVASLARKQSEERDNEFDLRPSSVSDLNL